MGKLAGRLAAVVVAACALLGLSGRAAADVSPPVEVVVIEQPWECGDRNLVVTDSAGTALVDNRPAVLGAPAPGCVSWPGSHTVRSWTLTVPAERFPIEVRWADGPPHLVAVDGVMAPPYVPAVIEGVTMPPSFVVAVRPAPAEGTTSTSVPTLESLPTAVPVGLSEVRVEAASVALPAEAAQPALPTPALVAVPALAATGPVVEWWALALVGAAAALVGLTLLALGRRR